MNFFSYTLTVLILMASGCANRPVSTRREEWPHSLTEQEIVSLKQIAWAAAESSEMWQRFKLKRISKEPIKLGNQGIEFYLDQKTFDKVEVAIPSEGRFGWHPCYIGVTIARGSYKVLGMEESFWP